jgi:lyso-ornithine lipid O-acyltransferase
VIKTLRTAYRLCQTLLLFASAFLDFVFRLWLGGKADSIAARAQWLKFWSGRLLRIIHVDVRSQGRPPANGILASNHLSYLDVLVLACFQPMVFVSKSEVGSWPVVGRLTRCAGTLYIVRQQKADAIRLGEEMVKVVEAGVVVVLFPEGTSSDGATVLPFRSPLLASAAERGWPVTGAWIHYALRDGSAADEVCYWRDMIFGPHLLNLLSKKRIEAFVSFGSPLEGEMDRKEMARALHSQVCGLKNAYLAGVGAGTPLTEEASPIADLPVA